MTKVILLGDSIARGVVRDGPQEKYRVSSSSFAKNCEASMDIKIENHAHLGSTVQQGLVTLHRIKEKVASADEAWLLFGGNDSNMDLTKIDDLSQPIIYRPRVDLATFQKKYSEVIKELQELGPKVTLLSLPPIALRKFLNSTRRSIHTSSGRCKWQKFIHHQPEILTNWHEMYNLSIFKLAHKHQLPIIDLTTPFLQKGDCEPYFCDDGIHPNNRGHLLITNAIMNARPKQVSLSQILFNHCQQESVGVTD